MKCERCGKDASLSVKAIVNGNEHNFYLCEDCMKYYTEFTGENVSDGKFNKINEIIDNYYEYKYNLNNHAFSYMEGLNQKTCPKCGNLESNIKAGIFGCSECYKLSDKLTNKILKTYNNFDTYTGKMPKAEREFKEVALEIKTLQEKLKQSVETEDYEQAADLKERIDDLNMKVKS